MSESTIPDNALLGVVFAAAIPVAGFALWADYVGRRIAKLNSKRMAVDRPEEIRRVRVAGIYSWMTEALAFLACTPVRKEYPAASVGIFLGALLFQMWIQSGLERAIRGEAAGGLEQLRHGLRFIGWTVFGLGLYFSVFAGMGFGTEMAARSFDLSEVHGRWAFLFGQIAGACLGFLIIVRMLPLFMRKLVDSVELKDSETGRIIEEVCADSGLRSPEIRVMEHPPFDWKKPVTAGLARLKGWMRPVVFISKQFVDRMSDDQVRVLMVIEAAHAKLKHGRKRVLRGMFVFLLSIAIAGAAVLISHRLVGVQRSILVQMVSLLIPLLMPVLSVRAQIRDQRIAADSFAVTRLGLKLSEYADALRQIDRLDRRADEPDWAEAAFLYPDVGFPSTEKRILLVRSRIEKTRGSKVESLDRDSDHKRAA